MGSGAKSNLAGSFVSDGTAKDIKVPGYTIAGVEIWTSAGVSGHWYDNMPDGSAFKRLANGTGSLVVVNGVTLIPEEGFTLGADAALNASGATIYWAAKE